MQTDKIRFSVDMSPELADKLDELAESAHTSKGDIFRKALFLMYVAVESKKKGNEIAVVNKSGQKVSDIIL